jgi:hypothetical protein
MQEREYLIWLARQQDLGLFILFRGTDKLFLMGPTKDAVPLRFPPGDDVLFKLRNVS